MKGTRRHSKALLLGIAFTFLAPGMGILGAAEPLPLERRSFTRVYTSTSVTLPYLTIAPATYNEDRRKRWPLLIFLHGSDQGGKDLNVLKTQGPVKTALASPDFPMVVVAPLLPLGKTWNPDAVASLVRRVSLRYRIDASRIYLTGLSTGGYGTWDTGMKYPERFAAIAPVAGGGSTLILKHAEGAQLASLRSLAVWAFHGGNDTVIHPSESQRLVAELQSMGAPNVRATIYSGAGHDIWSRVYDGTTLYDWLLQQQR